MEGEAEAELGLTMALRADPIRGVASVELIDTAGDASGLFVLLLFGAVAVAVPTEDRPELDAPPINGVVSVDFCPLYPSVFGVGTRPGTLKSFSKIASRIRGEVSACELEVAAARVS